VKNSDSKKLKAIKALLKGGSRDSEWAEAGLLHAIEKIISDEVTDLSSKSLKKLMEKAKCFPTADAW